MTQKRTSGFTEIEMGPTGRYVAANIAALRDERGLTYSALSKALSDRLHHEIPPIGLRRIEARARRVTVDDLVALAVALDCTPADLMQGPQAPFGTGVPDSVQQGEFKAWLQGKLGAFDRLHLYGYYEALENELDFSARLKREQLKQMHESRDVYPELMDYPTRIELLEGIIARLEDQLAQATSARRALGEAIVEAAGEHVSSQLRTELDAMSADLKRRLGGDSN